MDRRDELLIPVGPTMIVPGSMHGKAIGIGDPTKIAESFGRDYKPQMPLYLVGPDERTIILVAGMGQATAAELQDVALAALEREKDSDWEAARAERGLPQQSQLKENLAQLGEDRLKEIKRNRRTQGTPHTKRIF